MFVLHDAWLEWGPNIYSTTNYGSEFVAIHFFVHFHLYTLCHPQTLHVSELVTRHFFVNFHLYTLCHPQTLHIFLCSNTDPSGHRWLPTYPPGSKQLFSSLVIFTVFRVLTFWGRFEALIDTFWKFEGHRVSNGFPLA